MQEVSRVGAQEVTSKSKLMAREMPDLPLSSLGDTHKATLTCGSTITRRVGRDFGREMGDEKCMSVELMEHRVPVHSHTDTHDVSSPSAPPQLQREPRPSGGH